MKCKNLKKHYDLLVAGNSLAAVFSAGMAAKSGKSVAIISDSELLFSEFSEGFLGFVKDDTFLFSLLGTMGVNPIGISGEYHIPQGMAAKAALKYLRERNVDIYLKAPVIGILKSNDTFGGLAVATKFGAYIIKGAALADFTDRKYYCTSKSDEYLYSLQLSPVTVGDLTLPCHLDPTLFDQRDITLHGDCRSENTVLLTFKTNKSAAHQCLMQGVDILNSLRKNMPAFAKCGIHKYALRPIPVKDSEMGIMNGAKHFSSGDITGEDYYFDFEKAHTGALLLSQNATFAEPDVLKLTYGEFPLNDLVLGAVDDDGLSAQLIKVKIPTEGAPLHTADLFIAGLGAGGSAALCSASDSGATIIAAEAMPTPGGTRTHGMVSAYWHGYTGGFANTHRREILEFAAQNLGAKTPEFVAESIFDINAGSNHAIFYNTIVFDVIKEKGNTVGALLATSDGVKVVKANKTVDATGDADLAALSGAPYMKNGDGRDGVTQGYSVWGYDAVGLTFQENRYKSDEDNISTEKYSEFMRGIFASHSVQSDLGFTPMLTVRESRRIVGKHIITSRDILRRVVYDDTITLSLCRYDAHGVGSSPAYYTSLFGGFKMRKDEPDVCTRIPLRALLPKDDEGLMVVSKSISATRDAGCLIRMNPDILNTGYAGGLIAATAAKNGTSFEDAYTEDIKNHLKESEVLPDFYDKVETPTAATLLFGIEAGDNMAISCATAYPEYLADFEAAYDGDENLGRVLLAMGSAKPFDRIINKFSDVITRFENEKTGADTIKSYAILLSRVAAEDDKLKEALIPLLAKAIAVMESGGGYGNPEKGVYQNSKVSNRVVPNFRVIMGLAIAAETVADERLAAPLMALDSKPFITLKDGDEIHSVQLHLRLIAAAARCGDKSAFDQLQKYCDSDRLFFREFAKSETEAIKTAKALPLSVKPTEFWI